MNYGLDKDIAAMIDGTPYMIANLANISAYIYDQTDRLNWAGFYLIQDGRLILGPFQGKVACVAIDIGKGVCGTAVLRDETLVVPNVHEFDGHIACDCESNSEIVVPIHKDGRVFGVLDIDSPELNRFGDAEKEVFEAVVKVIEESLK